ncbi:hypothetical protein BASA61_005974 [Batrachochytrium salamandrivorans]|nr:hypothetical protein BASA61_005974 [Batrachochytrium salamandrivorans]
MNKDTKEGLASSRPHTARLSKAASLRNIERRATVASVAFSTLAETDSQVKHKVYRVKSAGYLHHGYPAARTPLATAVDTIKGQSQIASTLQRGISTLSIGYRPTHTPSLQILWKRDQEGEQRLAASTVFKDLPLTRMFRKQLFQIDLNGLYARLEHLSKAAEFRGAKDIIRTVYSFLVDYSRASFEVLPKLLDNIEIFNSLSNLPQEPSDDTQIIAAIEILCTIQMNLLLFLKQRDDLSLKMVEQIEMLEEENTLFKDFVGSHSPYTPDHKVEIQVKQVVLSVKAPTLNKETNTDNLFHQFELDDENHYYKSLSTEASAASTNRLDKFNEKTYAPLASTLQQVKQLDTKQHEPLHIENPEQIDAKDLPKKEQPISLSSANLLDSASGSDLPIAIYCNTTVQTDFLNPLEEQYTKLSTNYSVLQKDKEAASITFDHTLEELRTSYEERISTMRESLTSTSQKRIHELEIENTDLQGATKKLKAENGELQQDIILLNSEMNEYKLQIVQLKKELDGIRKNEANLKKDNDALKNMIKNEQAQARSAKETVDLWKVQMDEQTHMCILQSEEHKEMKEKLVHALQENINRRKEFEESKERVSTLGKQVEEITVDNSNMHSLNATMLIELNDALHEKEVVQEKNNELEKVVAKLMEYSETNMGDNFNLSELEVSNETHFLLKNMIDGNNLRITLLERKNEQLRAIQMKQVTIPNSPKRHPYHSTNTNTLLFDHSIVGQPPESSISKSKSLHNDSTYIIGLGDTSRPVSASSVVFLRPSSSFSRVITPVKNKNLQRNYSSTSHMTSRPNSGASATRAMGHKQPEYSDVDSKTINSRMYDCHHPPRNLLKYFHDDELETVENLNADMFTESSSRPSSYKASSSTKSAMHAIEVETKGKKGVIEPRESNMERSNLERNRAGIRKSAHWTVE